MDFTGCPYPIEKNAQGYFYSQKGLAQIRSDLLILLKTNPGERIMLPQFGTPLKQLQFEPNDETTADKARQIIINAIRQWEPRVTIDQLIVRTGLTADDDDIYNPQDDLSQLSHILYVAVSFFDPENIKEVDELVLEIPLSGA